MIARELSEFFAGFSPDGRPVVQRAGDADASSRTSTPATRGPAGRRSASATCAYSEDQAFGADMLAAGWSKVYHPGAAVLHAHDYGAGRVHAPLLRRVPRPARGDRARRAVRRSPSRAGHVRRAVGADRRWMAEQGMTGAESRALDAPARRSTTRGRKVFSALGSRAERLPGAGAAAACRSSDAERAAPRPSGGERRTPGGGGAPALPPAARVRRKLSGEVYEVAAQRLARTGPRRCSTRSRAWPSASACAWRW